MFAGPYAISELLQRTRTWRKVPTRDDTVHWSKQKELWTVLGLFETNRFHFALVKKCRTRIGQTSGDDKKYSEPTCSQGIAKRLYQNRSYTRQNICRWNEVYFILIISRSIGYHAM